MWYELLDLTGYSALGKRTSSILKAMSILSLSRDILCFTLGYLTEYKDILNVNITCLAFYHASRETTYDTLNLITDPVMFKFRARNIITGFNMIFLLNQKQVD